MLDISRETCITIGMYISAAFTFITIIATVVLLIKRVRSNNHAMDRARGRNAG
jgi:large-conductance mechanosensitive channel